MGSCYDIMEDEEALSVSPTQQTLPENEMADLDVEMCEKKQVRLKYALILHTIFKLLTWPEPGLSRISCEVS